MSRQRRSSARSRAWHRPGDLPRGRYDSVLDTVGTDVAAALVPGGHFVSIADHPLPDVPGAAQHWLAILPLPLTDVDRAAGYWWELSMRQMEVSRTIVFTAPRHARSFFEALVVDNLDIGRPEQVELIFSRHRVRRGRPPSAQKVFKTKLVTRGTDVTINAFYKHSRIKQYLKDSRALRIETVLNDPHDPGSQRRLHHLDELRQSPRRQYPPARY